MSILHFKALADETRLRLLNILFQYELSVNELVQILRLGQSRVSRHLKILVEAGLLRFRRDGLWVFYSAPPHGEKQQFLQAILPYFPKDRVFENDIDLAAQILEERSRKTRQFFNTIADDWDALNHEVLLDFDLPSRVMEALPNQCQVAVDLGCGTGEVLTSMMQQVKNVIGVDGSARMLDLCRSRIGSMDQANGAVSLRIGELSHLPLADHEAGFACINLVLHHLAKPMVIFEEVKRILQPGGTLFIADFISHEDESMRERYGDHWLGFNPREIETALEKYSFHVVHSAIEPVGKNLSLFLIKAEQKNI